MSQQREAKKTVDFVSVIDESIHKKDRSKKMNKIGEKQNKNNRLRSNLLRQSRLNKLLAIQYKLDISRRIKLQMANLFDSDNDRILSYAWTNCELSPELNYTQEQQLFVIQEENPQASLQPIPQVSNSNQQLSSSKQCNPNLLKNLAVTLKSWVNFPEGKHGKQMAEIWKYFKNSKKINKNLVRVLFGDIEEQPEFYEKIQETIPVLKEVSLLQFRSLQKKIRDETVSQLKKSDIEYILKYRRVKDRLEFNKYFYQFVQKLENGAVYNKKSK